jgi:hypothetical protein
MADNNNCNDLAFGIVFHRARIVSIREISSVPPRICRHIGLEAHRARTRQLTLDLLLDGDADVLGIKFVGGHRLTGGDAETHDQQNPIHTLFLFLCFARYFDARHIIMPKMSPCFSSTLRHRLHE